jgi:hypothetical protein
MPFHNPLVKIGSHGNRSNEISERWTRGSGLSRLINP